MKIKVGSRCIRKALYEGRPEQEDDYFLGQEVEIIGGMPRRGYIRFKLFDGCGDFQGDTLVDKELFIACFEPVNLTLENK